MWQISAENTKAPSIAGAAGLRDVTGILALAERLKPGAGPGVRGAGGCETSLIRTYPAAPNERLINF